MNGSHISKARESKELYQGIIDVILELLEKENDFNVLKE